MVNASATAQLWLLRGTLAALSPLPLPCSRRLGRQLGLLLAGSEQRMAKVTRRNVDLALPDLCADQQQDLARRSLSHTGALFAELGLLWRAPVSAALSRVVSVKGEEHITTKGGCLILGCHVGNWEVLSLWLARHAAPDRGRFVALFDPQGPREIVAWILQQRERTGARLLPLNSAGLRAALKTLRTHGRVGLMVDQVPARNAGVYAPFFGHPALTMTLAQQLLRRSGATAVFATAIRQPDGFDVTFRSAQGLDVEDPLEAAMALNSGVEACIAPALEQYLWSYKRYKRPPEGGVDPYA